MLRVRTSTFIMHARSDFGLLLYKLAYYCYCISWAWTIYIYIVFSYSV